VVDDEATIRELPPAMIERIAGGAAPLVRVFAHAELALAAALGVDPEDLTGP
jgi:hypothetical protein